MSIKDKLNKPFFEVSSDGLEYDDDLADDFDSLLPEEPSVVDCERVARHFGKMSLLRNSKSAERIIRDVKEYRIEKRIRKNILHTLEQSGGVLGIIELMQHVNSTEGQAGANAAIGLVYILQAEGSVEIAFEKQLFDFTLFGEYHHINDDNIVVKLIRN